MNWPAMYILTQKNVPDIFWEMMITGEEVEYGRK